MNIPYDQINTFLPYLPVTIYIRKSVANFNFTFISENVIKYLGKSKNELLENPQNWLNLIHSDDLLTVQKALFDLKDNGYFNIKYRINKGLTFSWIKDEARLLLDENEKPDKIIGSWTDVSDQKKFEDKSNKYRTQFENLLIEDNKELREIQRYTQSIIDSSIDMIIAVDTNRKIIEFNKAAQKTFGYTYDEVINKDVEILYADPKAGGKVNKTLIESGNVIIEVSNKRKDGTIFPALVSSSLLFDKNGKKIGFMGISRDITKQKQDEEALKRSEERIRSVFNAAPIPMSVTRASDGQILLANSSLGPLIGIPPNEVIGKCEIDFYYDPMEYKKLVNILSKETFVHNYEIQGRKADGRSFYLLVSVQPFVFDSQKAFITGYYDITMRKKEEKKLQNTLIELKQTQNQLIQSEKMASLGSLTAGIAHEIKNPLNFIINFAEYCRELIDETHSITYDTDDFDHTKLKQIITDVGDGTNEIIKHSKRIDNIVTGMLLHSRKESYERQMININYLLDENVNLVYHSMRAQDSSFNVSIEKNYDENIGLISVVSQDIGRAFLNILTNACYAVSNKKNKLNSNHNLGEKYIATITISTKNLDNSVEISIRDNGKGIPKEIINEIFNPFFTTKPPGEGTGLGLTICYDVIVQEHKGKIKVRSVKGQFTEFIMLLPKKSQFEESIKYFSD
ncbi:MAG: PAS domain S-box protein [Spirochaetota bacterium]|nr:PAS domain S-box protein [Spirochaetota bacterium]